MMKLRFFEVPLHGGETEDELNHFLAAHRIPALERHLANRGPEHLWAICVSYEDQRATPTLRKTKVDYLDVLSESEFGLFAKLRDLRKVTAERENVPAYALFTNEQLAEMARGQVRSREALAQLQGVGSTRVDNIAMRFFRPSGVPAKSMDQPEIDA